MSKEQNVIEYYVLCNKLKNIPRTDWQSWNIQRERVESIAEHVFGVQMLALAMWSEYKKDYPALDIKKVLSMLSVHELEETVIGDLTSFDINKEEKPVIRHQAIHKILSSLSEGANIEKLILEFDAGESPEAKFAFQCNKLECDLQAKIYNKKHCVNLGNQDNNDIAKDQNVIEYYVLCNKLKNIIRTGWKNWNVKRERVESIAEHVYGVQMLALAMWSEYKQSYPNLDIKKVLTMLAVHELEETVIGDLTLFDIKKEEKAIIGHQAVHKILSSLSEGQNIENLILEFDSGESPEAKFAFQCDKLECDLQATIYDEEHCVDLNNQDNNDIAKDPNVKELLDAGMSWSEMWLTFGQTRYPYDKNFLSISNYAMKNKIKETPPTDDFIQ